MTKTYLFTAAAALAMAAACTDANAGEWYGAARVGVSEIDVAGAGFDEGLTYGAGLGTSVSFLRLEANVDRLSGELDLGGFSIDADGLVYSATAYVDLPVGDNASVFAGAGLDYVDGEASFFGATIDANGDGWHWAAGGAYRLNDRVIVEAQVREINADLSTPFGDVDTKTLATTLGFRFEL